MRSGGAYGPHIFLDRSFGEFDAKLAQFALNAFGTPQAIVTRHLSNQGDGVCRHPRLPVAGDRFPLPQQGKEVAMPAQDRFRLDQQQRLAPSPDFAGQQGYQQPLMPFQFHLLELAFQYD